MSAKLKKIQADVAAIKSEIGRVGQAALDSAGVARRVDAWLDEQTKLVADHFTGLAVYLAYPKSDRDGGAWSLFSERLKLKPELAVALQAHFQKGAYREHLIQAAEEQVAGAHRVASHSAELEKLRTSLFALECEEEAEIERLEAAGETVYRRSDMDPFAILGIAR